MSSANRPMVFCASILNPVQLRCVVSSPWAGLAKRRLRIAHFLRSEIARLQNENAALKKTILAHGLSLPPGAAPEAPAAQNEPSLRLPSDADIDRAIAFVGKVWQRFIDAVARAEKQIFNKS